VKNQIAFTLIELLIVVAIIGILAMIAVPNFMNARTRALVSRVQADIKSTSDAVEFFMVDQLHRKSLPGMRNAYKYPLYYDELTEPITYINKWPIDLFKPRTAEEEWMLPTHFFLEYGSDTPINGDHEKNLREQGIPVYGYYFLLSYGPDQERESSIGSRSSRDRNMIWDYDPTNGLLSSGDLVRIQGDFSGIKYKHNGRVFDYR
jgi:general secretion pathway protein G